MATNLRPAPIDLLFQQARSGLCLLDSEGNVHRANAEWRRLLGRSFEPAGGEGISGRLDDIRRLSAEAGWDLTIAPVALEGSDGVLVTVVEKEKAETTTVDWAALTASEARHRALFNSMTEAFALHEIVLDDQGQPCDYRFLEVNPAFERLTGLASSKVLGKRVTEVLPGVDPQWIRTYGKVALTGGSVQFDRYEPAMGKHFEVFAFCPAPLQFSVLFLDTTQRKQAEQALRQSEDRYRKLVTELPIGIFHAKVRDGCTFLNVAGQRIVGLSEAAALGTGWTSVLDLSDAAILSSLRADVAAMNGTFSREFQLSRPDGQSTWVKTWVTEIAGLAGEGGQLVGALVDVTPQKVAETALQESEELYRTVVASMAEGVIVQDVHGGVMAMNRVAESILGPRADEMGGATGLSPRLRMIREDGSAFAPEDFPAAVALRTGQSQSNVVAGIQRPDGTTTWIKGSVEPLSDPTGRVRGIVTTMTDITDRRAMREQLAMASRLEGLATLVAGVAHEINNPLAGEMASQQLVGQELRELGRLLRKGDPLDREVLALRVDEMIDTLGDAEAGAKRIERIVRDLSAFGRPGPQRARVRLLDVVESAMQVLPTSIASRAAIRVEPGEPPDVLASEGQIEQVVVNLLTNAVLAIPEGRRGEITIRLGEGHLGMVRLDVMDNGTGIDPKNLSRIFDPFFTTRDVGKGTGLGLPICHAIVMAHGGTLTVQSVPGEGSMFRVELPAAC